METESKSLVCIIVLSNGKMKVKCTLGFPPKLSPQSPYIFQFFFLVLIIEMLGKSPTLFLSQIIDLESNKIPSLPWWSSAVPFISSGLTWHRASAAFSSQVQRKDELAYFQIIKDSKFWLVCMRNTKGIEKRKFGPSQMRWLTQTCLVSVYF